MNETNLKKIGNDINATVVLMDGVCLRCNTIADGFSAHSGSKEKIGNIVILITVRNKAAALYHLAFKLTISHFSHNLDTS